MDGSRRSFLIAVFGGPLIVGLILWGLSEWRHILQAEPDLRYQTTRVGQGFADISLLSASTEPFPIHGVLYRIVAVLRQAPVVLPAQQPRPMPKRWFRNNSRPGSQECGTAITPDDVTVTPGPPVMDKWTQGQQLFLEVDAKKGEVIHFQIKDSLRKGACYRVQVAVVYGDRANPKTECVPPFDVDVVGD